MTEAEKPFCYVSGGYRLREGTGREGLVRRAADRSRVAWFDVEARRFLNARPEEPPEEVPVWERLGGWQGTLWELIAEA